MKKSPKKLENSQTISGADFENYFQPRSLKEALEIKNEYGSDIIIAAGTTDLFVAYYERLHEIKNWLDLSKVDKLKYINFNENIEF